jgi:RNA polymerase sigma factor (sigma-70 family)
MIPRDSELLRRYCGERSEDAFAQLVERHLGLVYAVALRQAGNNAQVAEVMAQAVFTDLAEHAQSLQEHATLAGWLYSRTLTAEVDSASEQPKRKGPPEAGPAHSSPARIRNSEQLEPVIGEAIDRMAEIDRSALLLHYRDNLDFRTVGAVLGLSDEGARQRVTQALEELRGILRAGGRTTAVTLKTLGTVLSASGLVRPPAGLAHTIAKTAVVKTDAGSGLSTFLRANRMKAALAALLLVALLTALIIEQRSRADLTAPKSALRDRNESNPSAPERNRQAADRLAGSSEQQRLRKDQRELMRSRTGTAELRKETADPLREEPSQLDPETSIKNEPELPVVSYFAQVSVKLARGQSMVTGGWRTKSGKRTLLLVTPEVSDGAAGVKQINFQTVWVAGPDDVLTELGLDRLFTDARTNDAAHLLSEPQTRTLMAGLVGGTGVEVLAAPRLTTKDGMQARIDVTQSTTEGDVTIQAGPAVELTPKIGADGTLDLTVNAQFSELKRNDAEPNTPEPPAPEIVEEDADTP